MINIKLINIILMILIKMMKLKMKMLELIIKIMKMKIKMKAILNNILNKCDKKITDTNYDSIYNNKDNKNKRTSRYYKLYTD